MPKTPKTLIAKDMMQLVKESPADSTLKSRAYNFLRTDLSRLKTASDFGRAASDLGALAVVLAPYGLYKDTVKLQFEVLRELRHLHELRAADRMLSKPEKAERIMNLLRPYLPKDFWQQIEDLLNTFMAECEEE
jgi:hypothetical protein